jgi:membrane glycosyltransferase
MSYSDSFEEIDMAEFLQKQKIEAFQRSRHKKFLSETISTNSCTFELERPSHKESKVFDVSSEVLTGKKLSKKRIFELPERLNFLKQITENKIKFLKVEQDHKELEECTFKPKTNVKSSTASVAEFLKHQKAYSKAKNSADFRMKMKNCGQVSCRNLKNLKVDPQIFERLYKDSKVLTRSVKRLN